MAETEQSAYLDYLPAIYSDRSGALGQGRDESAAALARFLVPFEAQFEGLRDLLAEIDHFFAPDLAPTGPDFLAWLAEWVALTLDQSWDEAKQRQVLAEAVKLYRYRGTAEGIVRFLDIYTGRRPQIADGAWPAGFQIGVASRLPVVERAPSAQGKAGESGGAPGGGVPDEGGLGEIKSLARDEPVGYHDYYIVRTPAPSAPVGELPADHPLRRFMDRRAPADDATESGGKPEVLEVQYRADKVIAVDLEAPGDTPTVTVHLTGDRVHRYAPASVIRQDHVIEQQYTFGQGTDAYIYRGDALLVEAIPLPHRFTVHLTVPRAEWAEARKPDHVSRIRSIIDEVKPAHTVYALRMMAEPPAPPKPEPGRIGVDLQIGIDSVL